MTVEPFGIGVESSHGWICCLPGHRCPRKTVVTAHTTLEAGVGSVTRVDKFDLGYPSRGQIWGQTIPKRRA